MKKFLLVFLFLLSVINLNAQKSEVDFLPAGLHFLPLKANVYEAKLGLIYFPDDRSLKVDIGNSVDLVGIQNLIGDIKVTLGIDFMAYGLASSYQGKRLQIDALDGFFGGNATFSHKVNNTDDMKLRLRIIHNSAHLVDGSYNNDGTWKNNYLPVPYARDFIEPTFAYEINKESYFTRFYVSPSYSMLVRPAILKRWSFNTGFELALNSLIGKTAQKSNNLYFAYQFSLIGVPAYAGNNNFMFGIKMGEYYNKGINLFLSYYTGMHYFSEYYVKKIDKFGIGFYIDF